MGLEESCMPCRRSEESISVDIDGNSVHCLVVKCNVFGTHVIYGSHGEHSISEHMCSVI